MERGLHSTGDQEFIYGDRDDRNQSKSSCISPGTETRGYAWIAIWCNVAVGKAAH